jgi:hypothetical protein
MTLVKINGKDYPIECSIYVLVQYCKRIGENSVTVAMSNLSNIGDANGIKADGVENWASILYEMLLRGSKKAGKELDLDIEDCYDTITDVELISTVIGVIASSMPDAETIRKSKEAKAA